MSENKIFNDPIHGTISLEPFLVQIIDTPEFQRLRHVKQLGGVYYVYPEAQHNRFEHSIGTAHLAGKLVEHLKRVQPVHTADADKINDQDILCVKVAGLCHDLGHGPFSHLFDGAFLPRKLKKSWRHEEGSCDMFDRLIERVDPECKTLNDEDRTFIKEMINGKEMGSDWPHKGRPQTKSFLYEIISNKANGVDVDKWDYFARDCHHLGISNGFDHNRLIEFTKVLEVEDENGTKRKRICYRDKEVYNLYEMFHTRFSLHRRAYQHKAAKAIEHMICDALCKANDVIKISGGAGGACSMSECVLKKNLGAYCNLDDRILQTIEHSEDQNLEEARQILKRLSNGDRYRCIGNRIYRKEIAKARVKVEEDEICNALEKKLSNFKDQLKVSIVTFNYGKGNKNPIGYSRFYSKSDPNTAKQIPREEVSTLLPSVFQERWVRVFCTKPRLSSDQIQIETAKKAFDEWYRDTLSHPGHQE